MSERLFVALKCSECGQVILNSWGGHGAYWQCDHGPYGAKRRCPTDRELLEEILERVTRLEGRIVRMDAR